MEKLELELCEFAIKPRGAVYKSARWVVATREGAGDRGKVRKHVRVCSRVSVTIVGRTSAKLPRVRRAGRVGIWSVFIFSLWRSSTGTAATATSKVVAAGAGCAARMILAHCGDSGGFGLCTTVSAHLADDFLAFREHVALAAVGSIRPARSLEPLLVCHSVLEHTQQFRRRMIVAAACGF